jgi:hypothetical protein
MLSRCFCGEREARSNYSTIVVGTSTSMRLLLVYMTVTSDPEIVEISVIGLNEVDVS